mmetsp:Transcript_118925/g.333073  ORF Transcript_118925/g.333073 Transcript_118925/m.333073 type:complete len:292 (-) Transcript_118925:45-920(-)
MAELASAPGPRRTRVADATLNGGGAKEAGLPGAAEVHRGVATPLCGAPDAAAASAEEERSAVAEVVSAPSCAHASGDGSGVGTAPRPEGGRADGGESLPDRAPGAGAERPAAAVSRTERRGTDVGALPLVRGGARPKEDWPRGNLGHLDKLCKPCLYFNRMGGCSSGAECRFCHEAHRKVRVRPPRQERIRCKRAVQSFLETGEEPSADEVSAKAAVGTIYMRSLLRYHAGDPNGLRVGGSEIDELSCQLLGTDAELPPARPIAAQDGGHLDDEYVEFNGFVVHQSHILSI